MAGDSTIKTISLDSPSGPLELLTSCPKASGKPPILFIHGAQCSARDYKNFLSFFSKHSYPSYALSTRGHGSSWHPTWIGMMFFTTIDDFVADTLVALGYICRHHDQLPIVVGHSLGGALVQYMLSRGLAKATALVLLASAPLTGGKIIMDRWDATSRKGEPQLWFWQRGALETPRLARVSFFSEETPEEVIIEWMLECRTATESLRTGLAVVLGGLGEPDKVLAGLSGIGSSKKKVLFVAADGDVLVTPDLAKKNMLAYKDFDDGDTDSIGEVMVRGSGHHVMMDMAWEDCAKQILEWLNE